MKTLLLILPYAGLILSSVAAIWGLTHELYTKDENNNRHLTKAGKYSIAYTLLGLLISFNTGVLKTITDKQDRENAKSEAARKEQQDVLKELARQQQEEVRQQELREGTRRQEAKLAEVDQKQRDDALAAQQRDLSLKQQQLAGFNEAERRARQRTLSELQRSNKILFNVNRSQYPIGSSISVNLQFRISTDRWLLKKYARQIRSAAQQMVEMVEQRKQTNPPKPGESWLNWALDQHFQLGIRVDANGTIYDEIFISDESSPLLPQDDFRAEELVKRPTLYLSILGKDQEINVDSKRDITFGPYSAYVFVEDIKYKGTLSYSRSKRAYINFGPHSEMGILSNGKLVS
jgi:hypothetical protein